MVVIYAKNHLLSSFCQSHSTRISNGTKMSNTVISSILNTNETYLTVEYKNCILYVQHFCCHRVQKVNWQQL